MKNFAMGQATVEKAFAGQKAKRKQREAKLDKAYQDTSTIRVKGQAINAGDMTANIRKQTNIIADDFYANELAYIDEKIDRQTYQTNRDKHLGKLQGMVDIGGELSKVDLSNIKVSRHQKDKGKTLGLIESYNNQAVDIDYSGDLPKLYYMDPNNNRVEVDLGALKNINVEDLDINEVYTIDKATKEGFVEGTFTHTQKMTTSRVTDGPETIVMQVYDKDMLPPNATKEDVLRINKEYEQGIINKIDANLNVHYNNLGDDDRGSLFADSTFASYTMGKNENNTFQPGQEAILDNVLSKIDGITDEDIKHVKEQLLNGTYNGTDEQKAIMDQVSKDSLAHQIFNSGLVPKAQNQGVVKDELQMQDDQVAREIKGIQLEKLKKGDDDTPPEIKPFEDYVKQTYGGTQTGTEGKRIMDFLTDYNSLGLNTVTSADSLIETLKTKSSNQLGVQVGGNPYQNYTTVTKLRGQLLSNPEMFGTRDGKSYRGKGIQRTLDYLSTKGDNEIVILPTKEDSNGTYFYIGDNSRKQGKENSFQFLSDSDDLNLMVEILKSVEKFKNVDPDVLYKELELYKKNPNRFN